MIDLHSALALGWHKNDSTRIRWIWTGHFKDVSDGLRDSTWWNQQKIQAPENSKTDPAWIWSLLYGTMTLWSPWGPELGAGCYFVGSERSQFGIQRQFNQLISSLSLVHKHCARWSRTIIGSKTFMMELPVDDGGNWNCLRFSLDLMSSMFFLGRHFQGFTFQTVLTAWSFPQLFGGPLLIWFVDSPMFAEFSPSYQSNPGVPQFRTKDFQLTALWGEMTHFYQPRIAMAPRRLIAVPLLSRWSQVLQVEW